MPFPTPVGGTPFPVDFAPSVLFAILYASLVPMMLYRAHDKKSRTTLLIGSAISGMERVVVFSLRAAQSHNEGMRISKGLITYMQISFGMGFISIANDLVNLVRPLLVNPTYGSDTYEQSPADHPKSDPSRLTQGPGHAGDFAGPPPENTPDNPRTRFWCRRFSEFTSLAFLSAIIPGAIANSRFSSAIDDPLKGSQIVLLRYVSCGDMLFLTSILAVATIWARFKLARVSRRGTTTVLIITFLLCLFKTSYGGWQSTIAIYRLSVMFHTTASILSTAPGSLNSHGAKATFYIFHAFPEWLSNMTLFTLNIRRMFGTGMFGDWRNADEAPDEREKRLEKEVKKAEKRRKLAMGPSNAGERDSLV